MNTLLNTCLTEKNIGWVQAIFNIVVLWGIAHIAIRYSAHVLNVHVLLFSCVSFAGSALVLLMMSGHGKLAYETLRSLDTWGYGLILLFTYLSVFLLFSRVSATEGSLFLMFGMNVSLMASWFFFSRTPTAGQLWGNLAVFIGLLLSCYDTPPDQQTAVYTLIFMLGVISTMRVFMAETHKPHTQAATLADPKARMRVVAFVMFIVSLIFTVVTVAAAFLKQTHAGSANVVLAAFPSLGDFLNPATMFAGLLYGALLMAPLRFLEFASTHRIKGENYLTVTALAPLSTLFWEWSTEPLTGLNLNTVSDYDLWACVLITAGAVWAALSQVKAKEHTEQWQESLAYAPQAVEQISDTKEIVTNTLEHFGGDTLQTAQALGISHEVLQAVLGDTDRVLALKPDTFKDVARNYRRNVAMADALTGLLNRGGFMTGLKAAAYEAKTLSLLYIDLDKFKPVNDTYGHKAGDFVLQGVAERLRDLFPKQTTLATRLGGDEFCVLLLNTSKTAAQKHVKRIQKEIAKPFAFEEHSIGVTASVGLASYPDDTKHAEELLVLADKGMYRGKQAR